MQIFSFSKDQEKIINNAVNMINSTNIDLFELTGIAGSGKSTLLLEILKRSGIDKSRVMGCAITGQAVSVLQSKGIKSKTIHSLIYDLYTEFSEDVFNEYLDVPKKKTSFIKKDNLRNIDLLIIDEAYMIDESIANDIKSFKNIKKIACGDFYQLPPISGKPGFLTSNNISRLLKPFRQSDTSGIYLLANDVINDTVDINKNYSDVTFINNYKNMDMNKILEYNVILCCTNKTKDFFNSKYRELKGYTSDLPSHGERVIFKKNNAKIRFKNISLVNGMVGTVIGETFKSDKNSFIIHFKPDMIDEILSIRCDYNYFKADTEKKKFMKSYSKYSNGEYLEYAYAATVHSYQGSQAQNCMFVDESYLFNKNIRKALQYTAITRAVGKFTWCK